MIAVHDFVRHKADLLKRPIYMAIQPESHLYVLNLFERLLRYYKSSRFTVPFDKKLLKSNISCQRVLKM